MSNKWTMAKKALDNKNEKFNAVYDNYSINDPGKIKKSPSGKYQRIRINLPKLHGYECQLVIYQSKKYGIKTAFYVICNNERNTVYINKLIDDDVFGIKKKQKKDEFLADVESELL